MGFVLIYRNVTLLTNFFIESLKSPRLSTVEVTFDMDHIATSFDWGGNYRIGNTKTLKYTAIFFLLSTCFLSNFKKEKKIHHFVTWLLFLLKKIKKIHAIMQPGGAVLD